MNKHGFLVTCIKNKEKNSQKEVLDFLHTANYQPHLISQESNCKKELEIALLNLKKNKFEIINLKNTQCVYLISTNENVLEIYKNLNHNLKYTFKINPLSKFIFINDFKKLDLKNIFYDFISESNLQKEKTYKIIYEHRNTNKEVKVEVFDYLVKNIQLKVNLKSPDFIFTVQIVKNYLGCSVLKNNFN